MSSSMSAFAGESHERLLQSLAEQLKVPLIHIARLAELTRMTTPQDPLHDIETTADMALRLIDSYLLSIQLQAEPVLELEPVSVSAVMQDVAHRVHTLARRTGCDVRLELGGKYGPVMAHRQALEAAFTSLSYAFVEAAPQNNAPTAIVLSAHKSGQGIVTGVFGDGAAITADSFRRARALYGHARQALPGWSQGTGAGVFVADALLRQLSTPLRTARRQHVSGLAATLLPSRQMQLL